MDTLLNSSLLSSFLVGDIITVGGKTHKVTKVGKTAICATRHYWFDAAWDWVLRKIGGV